MMTIELMHQIWTIEKVPSNSPDLFVGNEFVRGACWCGHQRIVLSQDLTCSQATRVITHELTHAYLYAYQVHVNETFTEEELCEFVAIYGMEITVEAHKVWLELFVGKGVDG